MAQSQTGLLAGAAAAAERISSTQRSPPEGPASRAALSLVKQAACAQLGKAGLMLITLISLPEALHVPAGQHIVADAPPQNISMLALGVRCKLRPNAAPYATIWQTALLAGLTLYSAMQAKSSGCRRSSVADRYTPVILPLPSGAGSLPPTTI